MPDRFYKMGYNTKRWKDIQVPGSWELQGFDSPIYTDVAYPFPANPPHVPTDYNPVGAYIREFTVPAHWKGMDIFLDFEGVESAFYCWVNGELAGYSEDSRLPAHFNITPFLKAGKNKLAVKVSVIVTVPTWRIRITGNIAVLNAMYISMPVLKAVYKTSNW